MAARRTLRAAHIADEPWDVQEKSDSRGMLQKGVGAVRAVSRPHGCNHGGETHRVKISSDVRLTRVSLEGSDIVCPVSVVDLVLGPATAL